MNKKGYTIMEAVIAMFLVVVMVGTVFSALMSSRRAIVSSSEKEETLYSLNSAYAMLKDCRANSNCHLRALGCSNGFSEDAGTQSWKTCNELFTFNFKNLCTKNDSSSKFDFSLKSVEGPVFSFVEWHGDEPVCTTGIHGVEFYTLDIDAQCTED